MYTYKPLCKLTKSRIGDRNGTYFAIMLPFYFSKKGVSRAEKVEKKQQIEKLNMEQHTLRKSTIQHIINHTISQC